MSFHEFYAILTDVLVGLAAITGAVVAVYGLSAWRKQLKAKADHDLARKLLINLHKHRDAIVDVRNPIMLSGEAAGADPPDRPPETESEQRFNELAGSYQTRLKPVQQVRAAIYPDLVEADISWGEGVGEAVRQLFRVEKDLRLAIQRELQSMNPRESTSVRDHYRNKAAERFDTLSSGGLPNQEDVFAKRYQEAFDAVETVIKPKLLT